MSEAADTLRDLLEDAVESIRDEMQSLGINASGESASKIKVTVMETTAAIRGTITAPPGVIYTDSGRGPSRSRGNGGSFTKDDAKEWARDKGLPVWMRENGKAMSRDEQAFLIMRKVHQKGFYGDNRQGKEYLDPILTETTDQITAEIKPGLLGLVKQKLNYGTNTNRAA